MYNYTVTIPTLYARILGGFHTLIGGTSGSGKSTLLKGVLNAIVEQMPLAYKLVLLDPKKVELCEYKNHAFIYADTLPKIKRALLDCESLMMKRYERMKREGLLKWQGETLLIVIDEFADLMDNKKEFLPIIARLLRLGRASRVFLILATQNPSRTSGLPASASSNINCRVALHCQSATESKQILQSKGAELLDFYGECLINYPNTNITRFKVPFVYTQGKAQYIDKTPLKRLKRATEQKEKWRYKPLTKTKYKPYKKRV